MKYLEVVIPQKVGYLIPIGDLHIGDPGFKEGGLKKLKGYLDWVKERPEARIFLNGDIFNVASRTSPTSPFETDTTEYQIALDIFAPYKKQIIGGLDGNHEARMINDYGFSPVALFCHELGIPYCGWSALIKFKIHKRNVGKGYRQYYYVYAHHTTGGGGTIGGKLNRVVKLDELVEGVDVFIGSHNHQLAVAPTEIYYPGEHGIKKRVKWYVDCGSYLGWDRSYAEKGQMRPTKLGSPRIRFDGSSEHHDCHVSL